MLNTFYIESNKAHSEYKASTLVLERIYCEKEGETVKEYGSSVPYLFVVDFDNKTGGYKVISHWISKRW